MTDDLNLQISSVRFQTRRGYDVAADLDRRIDATKAAMRMAFQLGAPHVVNQIGRVPSDTQSPGWQQLRTVMEDLGRQGAHIGAFLAAETGTEPGEHLAVLIGGLENAYVSAALNPGQLIVNGYSVSDAVRALASDIGLVVAQDGVQDLARGRGIEVPLGQGTADYPEILGTLEDAQYRGWFVVGRPGGGAAEAGEAIQYLTNL